MGEIVVERIASSLASWGDSARSIGRVRELASSDEGIPKTLAPVPGDKRVSPNVVSPEIRRYSQEEVDAMIGERVTTALDKGYENGFSNGIKSVQTNHQKHLELVQNAIRRALEKWDSQLNGMEGLTIDMAKATVEKVLGNIESRQEILQDIVKCQVKTLSDTSILQLRMSEQDCRTFPELIKTLKTEFGERMLITSDHGLSSGACMFDLELGKVDAGIDTHLDRIRALFSTIGKQNADV